MTFPITEPDGFIFGTIEEKYSSKRVCLCNLVAWHISTASNGTWLQPAAVNVPRLHRADPVLTISIPSETIGCAMEQNPFYVDHLNKTFPSTLTPARCVPPNTVCPRLPVNCDHIEPYRRNKVHPSIAYSTHHSRYTRPVFDRKQPSPFNRSRYYHPVPIRRHNTPVVDVHPVASALHSLLHRTRAMADLTTHFYLFAKNPHVTAVRNRTYLIIYIITVPCVSFTSGRILAGYPDEHDGVKYTTRNRSTIIGVVNTACQVGVPALFPILPELLAVRTTLTVAAHTLTDLQPANGGAYNTHLPDGDHAINALLIWEELDIRGRLAHKHATYGIHFALEVEAPACAVQLALLLIHLATDGGSAIATPRTPKLADLVYSITPSGVYGTAYFNGLRRAFKAAKNIARIDSYFSRTLSGTEMPISTLPPVSRALAQPQLVFDCYETVRYTSTSDSVTAR